MAFQNIILKYTIIFFFTISFISSRIFTVETAGTNADIAPFNQQVALMSCLNSKKA